MAGNNDLRLSVVVTATTDQLNAAMQRAIQQVSALGAETQQMAASEAQVTDATNRHATAVDQTAEATQRLGQQTEGLRGGYERLNSILGALGLGLGARELAETADAFANLQARVKLATGEGAAFQSGMEGVKRIASETATGLEATANLFGSIANATRDLKLSQQDQLALTKAINQAVQVSGASTAAAEGAITQLAQALASGTLRGDEFNSINEQTPRVMQALADGLGVARGALRGMAEQGQLTAELVTKALLSQSEKLTAEYDQLPATVGRAMTELKNQWMLFIGEADRSTGASQKAAEAIKFLSENLSEVATVIRLAGEAWLLMKGADVVAALNARATASFAAANALRDQTVATNQATQAQQANTVATTQAATAGVQTRTQLIAEAQARREQALALVQQTNAQVAAAQETLRNTYLTQQQLRAEMELERTRLSAQVNAQGRAAAATRMAELGRINAQVAREQAVAQEQLNLVLAQQVAASNAASVASRNLAAAQGTATASMAASRAAAAGLMARLGQFGLMASLAWILKDALVAVGNATGEWLAKRITGIDIDKQEAEAARTAEANAKIAAENKRIQTEVTERFAQAQTGASKAALDLAAAFDKAAKAGESAADALKKVQDAMNLSSTKGIDAAIGALRTLEVQGKITGEQARKSLQDELAKVDLVVFRANAKAAFDMIPLEIERVKAELARKKIELDQYVKRPDATKNEINRLAEGVDAVQKKLGNLENQHAQMANKMAIVQDATLNEAIRRTGLTYDQLQGKMGETANSAINDVDLIVGELGKLQKAGVNTSDVLGAGLSRAIREADTPQALEMVRARVVGLQGELGQKVADGLLNQANQQAIDLKSNLDKMRPGINSLAEAMHEFGMKTREEFAVVAQTQKAAFLEMEKSGQATKEQLIKAFMEYSKNAIAANGGVADGFVRSKAAALGLTIETDEYGKNATVSLNKVKVATDAIADSTANVGRAVASTAALAEQSVNRWNSALTEAIAKQQEAVARQDELLSKQRGAQVNSAGNLSGVSALGYGSADAVKALLLSSGYSGKDAASLAKDIFQGSVDEMRRQPIGQQSLTNAAIVEREVQRILSYNTKGTTGMIGSPADYGITAPATPRVPDSAPASTTRLELVGPNGQTVTAAVPQGQDSQLIGMLTQLGIAKKLSGG